MIRVLVVFGTRPEAIAVPSSKSCRPDGFRGACLRPAQHREMLDQVLTCLVVPDVDLNLMRPAQSLPGLTARIRGLAPVFDTHAPDIAIVQGDTTTTLAGSLAAFTIAPIAHVEAGLRTGDMSQPFLKK